MNKIYRSKHGMLAVVTPDGRGVWVHSLNPILSRIDLSDGWTEVDTSYDLSR